ncbi:succinate dehydrogenase cytochrome b558 subunit [Calderihabitans maritimus]|uniref:Succinate dehydrogenase, cytochrome b558 subunit n=1 Tax=Calderihabitans maritimus TaxID=1246530 RepID=A0A1Z5HU01_9FIRM|nr:succinate dehydrogenase cytochrome b558 subunit [Calderihabitans maritimus]GAW92811.1 succinate dehydrogenase, cytochrome b558 subunit [Calderihabitans maritimus]
MSKIGFVTRKVHSLAGVVPLTVFLFEHLYLNSFALKGAEAYNQKIAFMKGLPYLGFIELVFIFMPLLFHSIYGIYVVYLSKNNVLQYPYYRNWLFYLQRLTAIVTLVFVSIHIYSLRFANLLYGKEVSFAAMQELLLNPWVLAFYVIGVIATVFHMSNGLWGFLVSWGIAVGPRAQQVLSAVCGMIFILLSYVGINALMAFV